MPLIWAWYAMLHNIVCYIKFSGILSGSKSIKRNPASDDVIFIHTYDIIFDQPARSIFAHCQALAVFQALVDFI